MTLSQLRETERWQPFIVHEEGHEGWVGMGLFGLCGQGATRQLAWEDLLRVIQERLESTIPPKGD